MPAHHHHHGAGAPGLSVPQRSPSHPDGLTPQSTPVAAAAGLIAHLKGEARELGSGASVEGQTQNDATHSQAGDYGTQANTERSEPASVTALAAFASCALHELAGDVCLLSSWNLVSRERPDLRAVMAVLLRMGTLV